MYIYFHRNLQQKSKLIVGPDVKWPLKWNQVNETYNMIIIINIAYILYQKFYWNMSKDLKDKSKISFRPLK
jgi:hypothetical protein